MTATRANAADPVPRPPAPGATRILGIDPGSQRTGVGIIDVDAAGRTVHVFHAPLNLLGGAAAPEEGFPARLKRLLQGLSEIIDTHRPDEVAIEQIFMARNPDSALKLGQARGAALCAAVLRDLPIHEYAAKEIKLALVGKGGADKVQVQHMVGVMLNLKGKLQADAADALAVAITHAHVRATARRLGVNARQAWSRK
ncbi:crossover junction endodeoxyribonuclease RuvC [Luteimonas aquatica]|uniref:crossover junction endodeoxyribonuclease RuvC n=1 Tax=Luteimonas aquatica TaxID=450364 RepID=UPI001F59D4F7|nr:crossover junction endodeoxyribonuclease RuvC [Luteimonas aquatica]